MKAFILFTSLLFATNCYSQITIVTPKEKVIEVQKYDSLASLTNKNIMQHVGQTIFIKGDKFHKNENGFFLMFFTQKISSLLDADDHIYKPTSGKKSGEIITSYSELVGKYYKIASVDSEKPEVGDTIYWLKLIGDDNIPFYYRIEGSSSPSRISYVVTLGYYEKMKQQFAGKDYYYIARGLEKVDSKEEITPPAKTRFKCTDMAINIGDDEHVYAVLENSQYGKVKGKIIRGKKLESFVSVAVYNQFVKKYGATFGGKVAQRSIAIGMNEDMVLDAWGAPEEIKTTKGSYGVHEQWIYHGRRYLYFQNGKLTSTQL